MRTVYDISKRVVMLNTGKVVFEGKDGLGSHLGATSVNGTVNSIVPSHQTFAMTSGVLGCDTEQTVKIDQNQTKFIANNMKELINDLSKGDGDYLLAYGHLLGCSSDLNNFSVEIKNNFDHLINDGLVPGLILKNTKKLLKESKHLKSVCRPTVG